MRWIQPKLKQTNGLSSSSSSPSPSPSPSPSFSYVPYQKESASLSSSSLSGSNRSPVVIFIIIILAVIFFLCGILHLLIRFFMKKRSSSSANTQSNSYPEISGSHTYQRQLQQLFTLHDSGLDQAFIDALPVFQYKEIMGLKEPFDCPVCLCEFSQQDKLRLLPLCSHAFHIDCIDTWLLSNSTCPLCRGTLFAPGFSYENPVFYFDDTIDEDGFSGSIRAGVSCSKNPAENDGIASEKTIFPVRLGKFRNTNGSKEDSEVGETSNSTLDARRCYSMGSFQYVVADLDLQVAFCPNKDGGMANCGNKGIVKARVGHNGNSSFNGEDADMKRINIRSKGESFSVSKIWLWSKKGNDP